MDDKIMSRFLPSGLYFTEARSPDPIFVFQGFQASHFRRNVGLILRCSPQAFRQSRSWVCHFSSIHVPWHVIHAAWSRSWRSHVP